MIGILEDIAEESLEGTNFFHSGPEPTWYSLNGDGESVHLVLLCFDGLLTIAHSALHRIARLRSCSLVSFVQTASTVSSESDLLSLERGF